jgi:hypothetical protein
MTSLPASATERYSIYTGRVTNWPMVAITSLLAVPLVGMMVIGGRSWEIVVPLGLTALGVVLNVLTASSVRATAGPNGVTVRWGVLGWPRGHYALADIEHAEVIDLSWWFVSWGYWWTPRRTCCTVQAGPTLRLTLRTGRTITITVPNPHAAVAAVHEATHTAVNP